MNSIYNLLMLRWARRQEQSDSSSSGDWSDSSSSSSSSGGGIPTDYVFYAPLKTDYEDHSTDARTMQVNGTAPTFTSVDGVQCASFTANSGVYTSSLGSISTGNHSHTYSVWCKVTATSVGTTNWMIGSFGYTGSNYQCIHFSYNNSGCYGTNWGVPINRNFTMDTNWHNHVCRYDSSTGRYDYFVDGTLIGYATGQCGIPSNGGIGISQAYGITAQNPLSNPSYHAAVRIYDRAVTDDEITALAGEFTPAT